MHQANVRTQSILSHLKSSTDNIVQFLLQAARDCLGTNDVVFAGGCPIFTDFVNFEDKKEIQPALLNAINACTLKAFAAFNEAQGKLEDINLLNTTTRKNPRSRT